MAEKINVFYSPEDGLVHQEICGALNEADAQLVCDESRTCSLRAANPGEAYILTDARLLGKASPQARRIFTESLKHKQIKKIAVWGARAFARAIITFSLFASGTRKLRFFASREDAVAWLHEDA